MKTWKRISWLVILRGSCRLRPTRGSSTPALMTNQSKFGTSTHVRRLKNHHFYTILHHFLLIIEIVELLDELTGHQNGVSCLAFANMHIWTGSYDSSVKSWDYVDLLHRIRERRNMKKMELYSFQAEAYQNYVDAKKSKRKRRKKKKGGMKKR